MSPETEITSFRSNGTHISIRRNYEKPGPINMGDGEPIAKNPCLILYTDDKVYPKQVLDFAYKPEVVKVVIDREAAIWEKQDTPPEDVALDLETIDELLFDEDTASGHIGPW